MLLKIGSVRTRSCDPLILSIYDKMDSKVVADLEKMIGDLYGETGSLRLTVAAIPEDFAVLFHLKSVHIIVKKFQNTIKIIYTL